VTWDIWRSRDLTIAPSEASPAFLRSPGFALQSPPAQLVGTLHENQKIGAESPEMVSRATRRIAMHFNGWQRVWLLGSILWAVVSLALTGRFQSDSDQIAPSMNMVLFALRLWIVPVVAAYAFGHGLVWVRRGFQVASK